MEENVRGPVFLMYDERLFGLYEVYDSQDPEEVLMEIWTPAEDTTQIEMVYERRGASWYTVSDNMIPEHVMSFIQG